MLCFDALDDGSMTGECGARGLREVWALLGVSGVVRLSLAPGLSTGSCLEMGTGVVLRVALSICLVKIISYAWLCEQGQDADLSCVPYGKEQFQAQVAKCS